jgi:hypothetical protein
LLLQTVKNPVPNLLALVKIKNSMAFIKRKESILTKV